MKIAATCMAAFGVALLVAGLILGFGIGVSSSSGFDCGTAFKESSDLQVDELTDTMIGGDGESGCEAARGSAKPLPVVLLALGGAAVLVGGGFATQSKREVGTSS